MGAPDNFDMVVSGTWYGGRSSFTVLRHYMVYTFDMLSPAGEERVYAMEEGNSGRPKRKVYPEG